MVECMAKCKKFLTSSVALPIAAAATVASVATSGITECKKITEKFQPNKGITMKKSTIVTIIVLLAAVAGALAAAYFYLARRERELNEYEELLFSEDCSGDCGCDDVAYEDTLDAIEE